MNRRGVLFTLTVLLFALAVINYSIAVRDVKLGMNEGIGKGSSLGVAQNKVDNVLGAVSGLERAVVKEIAERMLPFGYDLNGGLRIEHRLPIAQGLLDSYIDSLNAYRIFSNNLDDVNVEVPGNADWNSLFQGLGFEALPAGIFYIINGANSVEFRETPDFNSASLRGYDLNISLGSAEDFNSVACSFSGYAGCPDNDYNSGDTRPYFEMRILDENCGMCMLPQTAIRAHYTPSFDNTILVSCVGGNCGSEQLDIGVGTGLAIDRNSTKELGLEMGINAGQIETFGLADINVFVGGVGGVVVG